MMDIRAAAPAVGPTIAGAGVTTATGDVVDSAMNPGEASKRAAVSGVG